MRNKKKKLSVSLKRFLFSIGISLASIFAILIVIFIVNLGMAFYPIITICILFGILFFGIFSCIYYSQDSENEK